MEDIVELEALTSWGNEVASSPAAASAQTPFPIDAELNAKGKLWKLRADAILNSTNESMTDRCGVSGSIIAQVSCSILAQAGPQLEDELFQTEGCRTGEYLLPAKKIVHTVGPRYNERYKTAAESALHYCYRNAMELVVENKLSSLGTPARRQHTSLSAPSGTP
ncbi:hypothetical protein T484DRAFT_1849467 [Baffinella frigidus]|nr:hypothetical protein T484DRAFT_1849467 [Cryptophyta sp. CCMP2293]